MDRTEQKRGLILTGGGARAAYQVGVLRAVAELRGKSPGNPFPIICGTSAGAINAAGLATRADNFRRGVSDLLAVWRSMSLNRVYRSDTWGVAKTGARWFTAMTTGGLGNHNPVSLLDNQPLRGTLNEYVDLSRVRQHIADGHLYALGINATSYTSGQSVCFYEGAAGVAPWERARRIGRPGAISNEHLLASSGIPFIFPAVHIDGEFYGDGSMRQLAPLSPALHLGAERVMVIAVGRFAREMPTRTPRNGYPPLAQIAGHALSSIFLDSLEVDLERLQRINRTLAIVPQHVRANGGLELKPVDVLVISPSEEIDQIAMRYADNLPRSLSFLFRGIGATRRNGSILLSYLLFDREFCRTLIELGYRDAMAKRDEIVAFFAPSAEVSAPVSKPRSLRVVPPPTLIRPSRRGRLLAS